LAHQEAERIRRVTPDLAVLAGEDFCYLTTTGRKSGLPRTIEIWFAMRGPTLYMLADGGSRSHWVQNLQLRPDVTVRVAGRELRGHARVLRSGPEEALARVLLPEKYQPSYGGDLSGWSRTALPVAVDLTLPAAAE
jgi:deazaflavin-dependent oxidoreductase (nitroreductase family)